MTVGREALRRRPAWNPELDDPDRLTTREWLVTNGLGGYASGTVSGTLTRRYHGLLVASLPNPLGRTVMLNHLMERASIGERRFTLTSDLEHVASPTAEAALLSDFWLELGLPRWRFRLGDAVIQRRVLMPHRQNTVVVVYELTEGAEPLQLELQPAVHFRSYEAPVSTPLGNEYSLVARDPWYELAGPAEYPALKIAVDGGAAALTLRERRFSELLYRVEEARGYEFAGSLWSPGFFSLQLEPKQCVALIASTERQEIMSAITAAEAEELEEERRRRLLVRASTDPHDTVAGELVLAADQFVVTPAGRVSDSARALAVADEVRTVIAGYHWFTDWGRDTMISLEGLTLATGRHREAGAILRAFAQHVRSGLIPNMFPDGSDEGLYHTADATLWFFHALARYERSTGDTTLVRQLLPRLREIVRHHREGTSFGIAVDTSDGLLRQGAEGYQLTWMDAKVDGWVVTPRRGKAVEINALWYSALRRLSRWESEHGQPAESEELESEALRVRGSFNERFWYANGGYLYDVVDGEEGDSAECRPNQLFAIALDEPVLERERWGAVVAVVGERLLTPVGLRSLAPGSRSYSERYFGDLRTRDGAYHQGTVWGWLIGPWIDAWLKVHPGELDGARRFLRGLVDHLDEFGVGTLAEIFDAEEPYTPRGCIAQAWTVAEVLRCWVLTGRNG
jgi:predicted glycogen debranching enzyme